MMMRGRRRRIKAKGERKDYTSADDDIDDVATVGDIHARFYLKNQKHPFEPCLTYLSPTYFCVITLLQANDYRI